MTIQQLTFETAAERVAKGEHLYLVTIMARVGIPATFVMQSDDNKPLWQIYFILQGGGHDELRPFFDGNGVLCISNIVKLT